MGVWQARAEGVAGAGCVGQDAGGNPRGQGPVPALSTSNEKQLVAAPTQQLAARLPRLSESVHARVGCSRVESPTRNRQTAASRRMIAVIDTLIGRADGGRASNGWDGRRAERAARALHPQVLLR
eukprot:2525763-Rhodomonas_salina.3